MGEEGEGREARHPCCQTGCALRKGPENPDSPASAPSLTGLSGPQNKADICFQAQQEQSQPPPTGCGLWGLGKLPTLLILPLGVGGRRLGVVKSGLVIEHI